MLNAQLGTFSKRERWRVRYKLSLKIFIAERNNAYWRPRCPWLMLHAFFDLSIELNWSFIRNKDDEWFEI